MSTQYSYEYIKESIQDYFCSFFFDYNGKRCGVDVFSPTKICMWYGDEEYIAISMNDVFSVGFYDGETLEQIFPDIDIDLLE